MPNDEIPNHLMNCSSLAGQLCHNSKYQEETNRCSCLNFACDIYTLGRDNLDALLSFLVFYF
jgi:hypothetical protein